MLACIWYTLVLFFPPKEIKKMSFGHKNTASIPSNELLLGETKSQDPFNITAGSNSLLGSPQRNGDKAMSRQREGVSSPSGAQGIHARTMNDKQVRSGRTAPP